MTEIKLVPGFLWSPDPDPAKREERLIYDLDEYIKLRDELGWLDHPTKPLPEKEPEDPEERTFNTRKRGRPKKDAD